MNKRNIKKRQFFTNFKIYFIFFLTINFKIIFNYYFIMRKKKQEKIKNEIYTTQKRQDLILLFI